MAGNLKEDGRMNLRRTLLAGVLAAATTLLAGPAAAGPPAPEPVRSEPGRLSAAPSGELVKSPGGRGEAELLALDSRIAPLFISLAPEESLAVADWPVAPGVRQDVVLSRHEIYAPDARIFRLEGRKMTELPRSRLVFLWGGDADGRVRVFVSVDPSTGELKGLSATREGLHELVPSHDDPSRRHLLARAEELVDGPAPRWSCGQENDPLAALGKVPTRPAGRAPALITTLHTATIAIDTDNELMAQKFGNDTGAATNYVASLLASINVMYERDLLLRLLQGTTFLRVAPDPYSQGPGGDGNASGAQLSEFGNYWSANYGGVSRALAVMLSGKQPSSYAASGIAWIGGLCSTGYGYSFVQVFKVSYLAGDTLVVGHEMGHNLTSPHTHCYTPPVDICFTECYPGTPACPGVQVINGHTSNGTLMSYCHLLSCPGGDTMVFHPRTVNEYAGPAIQGAVGTCVFPLVVGPTVSSIAPNRGPTAGGTAVTIGGSSFQPGASVSIGGAAATGVTVVSSSMITAVTPAHAAGAADVTVTNPGNQSSTLANGYTYYTPPTAAVSGGGTICSGSSASIQAALTGAPPWSLSWSDGTTQTGVTASPATRSVSPATTTLYTVAAVSDANGPGTSSGGAAVTVATPALPYITAPAWVLPGATGVTASVASHAGSTYAWTVTNGALTLGQGTSQVTFTAGASGKVSLSVTETSAAGCASAPAGTEVPIGGASPAGLLEDAHAAAGTFSNVNKILEPGETVLVNASWRNEGASPLTLTGTASIFAGPGGATYSLLDAAAGYGTIAPGATADSYSAGGPSYRLFVSNPPSRPAAHWDATFLETLSSGEQKTWRLHVGSSFTDVPTSDVSYPFVETIFHRGITVGYGPGIYAPATIVSRWQMAVFLSRSFLGPGASPPVSGSVSGVGPYSCIGGGVSLFTDVLPTDVACPHIHDIYAKGVTIGCAAGLYCPNDLLPRWQMAVFLTRSLLGAGVPPPTSGTVPGVGDYSCTAGGNSLFADVPKTDIACPFIHYIYSKGITTGCAPGLYCPNDLLPRWQMAIFLVRTFSLPLLY